MPEHAGDGGALRAPPRQRRPRRRPRRSCGPRGLRRRRRAPARPRGSRPRPARARDRPGDEHLGAAQRLFARTGRGCPGSGRAPPFPPGNPSPAMAMRSPGSTSVGVSESDLHERGRRRAAPTGPPRRGVPRRRTRRRREPGPEASSSCLVERVVDRGARAGRIRGDSWRATGALARRRDRVAGYPRRPIGGPMSVLTESPAWRALAAHRETMNARARARPLRRGRRSASSASRSSSGDVLVDYSKNRVTDETMKLLFDLARQADVFELARPDVRRREDQRHRGPRRAPRRAAQPVEPADPRRRQGRDARGERRPRQDARASPTAVRIGRVEGPHRQAHHRHRQHRHRRQRPRARSWRAEALKPYWQAGHARALRVERRRHAPRRDAEGRSTPRRRSSSSRARRSRRRRR